MAEKKITFRSLKGSWAMAGEKYGVTGTPANFIIDRDGRVYFTHSGYHGEEGVAQMEREVEALLGRSAGARSEGAGPVLQKAQGEL